MSEKKKQENGNNFYLNGLVNQWLDDLLIDEKISLKPIDTALYKFIVRMCIGYGQYQTKRISIAEFQKYLSSSNKTVIISLSRLKDKDLIRKVISNKSDKQFKQAYRYELVFRKDLNFPNLGKLSGRNSLEQKEFEEFKKEKTIKESTNKAITNI